MKLITLRSEKFNTAGLIKSKDKAYHYYGTIFLLMPPGAMSLKIQVVFHFFFSVEIVHFNWISGMT